ncbi:DUF4194 domain-containing protein [Brevundimonas sp. M20]|uniref:DUF4194 domain-containing protein n=1 Tax=Brevundimonas sp. M20 TaxID=2591463 RepID=UPI0011461B1B|nr:DUF4194 domain-containing protein [Brevundimonas sp. M20]QDH74243.1 DUF4194 domain-containing protein [Brevundimonas sp. M20]
MSTPADVDPLSLVTVALFRGVTNRDDDLLLWQHLLNLQSRVRDYVRVLGLELVLDEGEGFAYLRQRDEDGETPTIPRLIPRRQLGFGVSLLLALLRKKLAEFDASSAEARLVLQPDEMVEMMRLFLPDTTNEARLRQRIEAHINRAVEMGFLRRMRGSEELYEVQRILKAFVDAQWLSDFNARLESYQRHASGLQEGDEA